MGLVGSMLVVRSANGVVGSGHQTHINRFCSMWDELASDESCGEEDMDYANGVLLSMFCQEPFGA